MLKPSSPAKEGDQQLRVRLEHDVYNEINAYISWVGLNSVSDFLEKASSYVLNNDYEWLMVKKNNKLYMKQLFQPIIKFAEQRNSKKVSHTEKPKIEIFKNINNDQKNKFTELKKILSKSKPINDARIFLDMIVEFFCGEFEISHSGTSVFLYELGSEKQDDSTMVSCIYPY